MAVIAKRQDQPTEIGDNTNGALDGNPPPVAETMETNESDALRERVLQLVCENWTDEAEYEAKELLSEVLDAGFAPVDELLRPCIQWDSGFWLDQMARKCFDLPDKDFEGEDWDGLLEEIQSKIQPSETHQWQQEGF